MPNNVYIHIPFCKSKCRYCSFISYTDIDLKEKYIEALIKEIKYFYKNEHIKTIYFGGGTPSILTSREFKQIIELFNIGKNTEITAEINPDGITEAYLAGIKTTGVNRLSFGCQTFNDKILKLIGRRHNSTDVINALNYSKETGFNNISLDFIYGLPEQTTDDFKDDLIKAAGLNIQHISLYGLKIEKGCYFERHFPGNLPDEDIQAEMYLKAIEILTQKGFKHYEISNFCKDGFSSKHNLNYWDNNTYYGFGVAAHGYEVCTRYSNTSNLKEYINNPTIHKNSRKLTSQEQLEEEIFLGFRKMEGINIETINQKFNINFLKKYRNIIDKYISYKFLEETNTGFRLTNDGILVSNTILAEFLE